MTEPRSANYRMSDLLADGNLAQILKDLRAEDLSGQAMARRLFADHGIEVTATTVLSWCKQMGIKSPSETAGAAS